MLPSTHSMQVFDCMPRLVSSSYFTLRSFTSDIDVPMGSSHCSLALTVFFMYAGHNGVGGTG